MICDRLRELRENKNLSQGDIEENLHPTNLDKHAWSMLEDLADLLRAEMPHFCDLDDRVTTVYWYDVFLLREGFHR